MTWGGTTAGGGDAMPWQTLRPRRFSCFGLAVLVGVSTRSGKDSFKPLKFVSHHAPLAPSVVIIF
jgi:hypothetical protein